MILLPKEKRNIRRYQRGGGLPSGGDINRYMMPGPAEQYMPLKPAFPDYGKLYQSVGKSAGTGGGRGSGYRPSRPKTKETPDAYMSDYMFAKGKVDELTSKIAEQSEDDDYLDSPEYKTDYAQLQEANKQLAMVESMKKNFDKQVTKDNDMGANAIFGDKAFVVNNQTGDYEVVDILDALSAKDDNDKRIYDIQNVSTALNTRKNDVRFNGFTEQGQLLQNIITSSYRTDKLYELTDDAFEAAGVSGSSGSDIVFPDGTRVDADEFYKHIDSQGGSAAQIQTSETSNTEQLQSATDNMFSRVRDDGNLMAAYRNLAISRVINSGKDVSKMSDKEFNDLVNQYIMEDLKSRARVFIENKFSSKLKETTKGRSGSKGPGDQKFEQTPFQDRQMYPKGTTQIDFAVNPEQLVNAESLDKDEKMDGKVRLHVKYNTAPNPLTFIKSGEKQPDKKKPPENFLIEHGGFAGIIDGNMDNALFMGDGSRLSDLDGGKGLENAVLPSNQDVKFLFNVPVVQDPETGEWNVNTNFIIQSEILKNEVEKEMQRQGVDLTKGDKDEARRGKEIMAEVYQKLKATSDPFRAYANELEGGHIQRMNVVSFDVITTADWDDTFGRGPDYNHIIAFSDKDVDDNEYERYSANDSKDALSWGSQVVRVPVFAVMKPPYEQDMDEKYYGKARNRTKSEIDARHDANIAKRSYDPAVKSVEAALGYL